MVSCPKTVDGNSMIFTKCQNISEGFSYKWCPIDKQTWGNNSSVVIPSFLRIMCVLCFSCWRLWISLMKECWPWAPALMSRPTLISYACRRQMDSTRPRPSAFTANPAEVRDRRELRHYCNVCWLFLNVTTWAPKSICTYSCTNVIRFDTRFSGIYLKES